MDSADETEAEGEEYTQELMWRTDTLATKLRYKLWLFCLVFVQVGIEFVYAAQFGVGTPLLSQQLKLSHATVALIIGTSSPISTFIMQPIVGSLSDSCTMPMGRRKPFIITGVCGSATGMWLVASSPTLGVLVGDIEHSESAMDHVFGIVMCVLGLWMMMLSTNMIQGPSRSLVSDLVPYDRQQEGNAMVLTVIGVSSIASNVITAQMLFVDRGYQYQFYISAIVLLVSMVPTLLAAEEEQHVIEDIVTSNPVKDAILQSIGLVRSLPSKLTKLLLAFFFTSGSIMPFFVYISAFYGQKLYGGDPHDPDKEALYQHGVQIAMWAMAMFAVVSLVYSLILPRLIGAIGVKQVYLASQLIGGISTLTLSLLNNVPAVVVLTCLVAFHFTVMLSIPFALMAQLTNGNHIGMYIGILQACGTFGQVIVQVSSGQVIRFYEDQVMYAIAIGGCLAILGSLAILRIELPKETPDEEVNLVIGFNQSDTEEVGLTTM